MYRKKILSKAVFVFGAVFSGLAIGQTCNIAVNQCSGIVKRVNVGGNGDIAIALEGISIPAEAGCASPTNFFQIPSSSPFVKENYAAALTAFAAGTPITIRTFDGDASCTVRSMFVGE